MAFTTIPLPELSLWLRQLSGILPLCALVEFIDVATKLHIFELNRSVPIWNWPLTPVGARLLLSSGASNAEDACYLDQVGRSPVLHCIDGRYGDWYPSSTQATTRMCISQPRANTFISNSSPSLGDVQARKQKLKVISLKRLENSPTQTSGTHQRNCFWSLCSMLTRTIDRKRSGLYWLTSSFGWVVWTSLTIICFLSGLYFAGVYLLLMPVTGLVVNLTHRGKPRRLLDDRPSPFQRLVIATDSLNGTDWLAFLGESSVLNSLLNKPLARNASGGSSRLPRHLLRLLIAGQGALALGSCSLQNWNAFAISFWIGFCAFIASCAYPPDRAARDWLRYNCNHVVESACSEFSSRRAMLGTLIHLNPDSKEKLTNWINPILADCADRRAWLSACLSLCEQGTSVTQEAKNQYWWKYIVEGHDMGRRIEKVVGDAKETQIMSTVSTGSNKSEV